MSPRTGSAPAAASRAAESSDRVSAAAAPGGEQTVQHRPADEAAGAGDQKGVSHRDPGNLAPPPGARRPSCAIAHRAPLGIASRHRPEAPESTMEEPCDVSRPSSAPASWPRPRHRPSRSPAAAPRRPASGRSPSWSAGPRQGRVRRRAAPRDQEAPDPSPGDGFLLREHGARRHAAPRSAGSRPGAASSRRRRSSTDRSPSATGSMCSRRHDHGERVGDPGLRQTVQFAVTGGTGAYEGARGSGTTTRPAGQERPLRHGHPPAPLGGRRLRPRTPPRARGRRRRPPAPGRASRARPRPRSRARAPRLHPRDAARPHAQLVDAQAHQQGHGLGSEAASPHTATRQACGRAAATTPPMSCSTAG